MIKVRKAQIADAPKIAAAEQAYIDCPWTEAQIKEEIVSPAAEFFVAETDGEFCGYVSAVITADECELSNIAVTEKYRRNGVGRALLTALLNEVRISVKSVFLLVRDGNTPAIMLYTALGFIAVGVRKNYYKDKDALIMRLNL